MNAIDLKNWIDQLSQDIDFEYHGKSGSICPFSHQDISLSFDGTETTVHSVDDAMNEPFICGMSLSDVCHDLII